MLGSISSRPCDAVKVVVSAPDCSAPCTAPAAPPSLCISCTTGTLPQMLVSPCADHSSASSAIVEDGVIGIDRADLVDPVGDVRDRGVAVHRRRGVGVRAASAPFSHPGSAIISIAWQGQVLEADGAAGAAIVEVAVAQPRPELLDGLLGAGRVALVALEAIAAGQAALRLVAGLPLARGPPSTSSKPADPRGGGSSAVPAARRRCRSAGAASRR